MQFTVVALLSLVAVAFASPIPIDAEAPAMSNANGDVVSFDTAAVVQPMTASGQ
ncbi:hypothetical protein B0J14DRAFT_123898 [Halenospora varia]|nr:hypothetical protein B0J14DRAFT_123898 [Halenospora varia]